MQEAVERVIDHDGILHDDVLPRLKRVEEELLEFKVEIGKITTSQTNLELTVMKDGERTRDLLGKFVDHYFASDTRKLESQEKLTMKKLSRSEKIILGFFAILGGSGGLIAGVLTILDKF